MVWVPFFFCRRRDEEQRKERWLKRCRESIYPMAVLRNPFSPRHRHRHRDTSFVTYLEMVLVSTGVPDRSSCYYLCKCSPSSLNLYLWGITDVSLSADKIIVRDSSARVSSVTPYRVLEWSKTTPQWFAKAQGFPCRKSILWALTSLCSFCSFSSHFASNVAVSVLTAFLSTSSLRQPQTEMLQKHPFLHTETERQRQRTEMHFTAFCPDHWW